jgi:hypothetical protein
MEEVNNIIKGKPSPDKQFASRREIQASLGIPCDNTDLGTF